MTDLQLVLTISIPSLLVIPSWIQNNSRLSRLESLVDSQGKRQDDTNRRIDDLQRQHHNDFTALLTEMSRVREEVSQVRERLALLETAAR